MDTFDAKADFLRNKYAQLLETLDVHAARKWGKMDVQQMIEHMTDYVRIASGRTRLEVMTAEERLPAMQAFLESEKQMRENTPNPLLPDIPPAARHMSKQAAIDELKEELDYFFDVHAQDANRITPNPFFGNLSYRQQVQLLHKHSTHHLRQFGVDV